MAFGTATDDIGGYCFQGILPERQLKGTVVLSVFQNQLLSLRIFG